MLSDQWVFSTLRELKGFKNSGGHCVHQGYCVCHNVIPFGIMPRCFAALFSVSHRLVAPWKNVSFTLSHSDLTRCDISCEAGQAAWRDHRRGRLVEHFSGTEFPCSSNCSSRRGSQALSCMSWLWWFSLFTSSNLKTMTDDDDDE